MTGVPEEALSLPPLPVEGPKICEPGGHGMFLPFSQTENELVESQGVKDSFRGLVYGFLLIYFFVGVAMISDVFMGSIEEITGRKKQVLEDGKRRTVKVWNDTVATLSLMALGSSAPEIGISVVDLFGKGFHFGEIGPATIVGSAAFNLLVIVAVCVIVIPQDEVRVIKELPAFYITAAFSLFAYVWLAFILAGTSPDVVDIGEAVATLFFLPVLIFVSYKFDTGDAQKFLARMRSKGGETEEAKEESAEAASGPFIAFSSESIEVEWSEEEQRIDVTVTYGGSCEDGAECTYKTELLTATPGIDFEEANGCLVFSEPDEDGRPQSQVINLTIPPLPKWKNTCSFVLVLEEASGASFDPNTDGEDDSSIFTVTLNACNGVSSCLRAMDSWVSLTSLRRGKEDYLEQFRSVLFVNGSLEEQRESAWSDVFFHVFFVPWKLFVLPVPPTSFFGGWLCFWVALSLIGLLTAWVSDLAELFGCVVGLPDIVTALTFVALGTSMPDLFASLTAAKEDPTADAAIVNVTGSNSVNVFLGLGLPWSIGSIYWHVVGRNDDWTARYVHSGKYNVDFEGARFMVDSGNICFCVGAFCLACFVALLILHLRRQWVGAELGGPFEHKSATAVSFICFWVGFVGISSWRVLRWDKSSWTEFWIVCGGLSSLEACISIGCIWSMWREYLKRGRRTSCVVMEEQRQLQVINPEARTSVCSGGMGELSCMPDPTASRIKSPTASRPGADGYSYKSRQRSVLRALGTTYGANTSLERSSRQSLAARSSVNPSASSSLTMFHGTPRSAGSREPTASQVPVKAPPDKLVHLHLPEVPEVPPADTEVVTIVLHPPDAEIFGVSFSREDDEVTPIFTIDGDTVAV